MKKVLLLLAMLLSLGVAHAETWTPVGQVKWTEGALTGFDAHFHETWDVSIERSDSRPSVYRLQPYINKNFSDFYYGSITDNVYLYLHLDGQNTVYIEPYHYNYYTYGNYHFHVFQKCPENGFDSKYYGKFVAKNTIEFPIGSFAVDSNTESTQNEPSSSAKNSAMVHRIVFPEGVLDYTPVEEPWAKIGIGYWLDPFWTSNYQPLEQEVEIEKSTQYPWRYRLKLFNDSDYVTINTEDIERVYISPYSRVNSNGVMMTVTQNCAENGMNGSKYGSMSNGKITIPGDCFVASSGNQTPTTCSSERVCEITFPDGYDSPLPDNNGVFMGIIGFNDEITRKPMSLLNEQTKGEYHSFIDGLQMGNATLLYYAVDQAISSLKTQTFPENLSNAVVVTFTDGLDQGSLAMKPEYRTSKGYADYLSGAISGTSIQGLSLEAYAIGLKSADVYDDELFMYNLQALASKNENISSVSNIAEMQQKFTELVENLNQQTTQRVVTIKVPMMSHGDKYRFTLDHSRTSATSSDVWFEGDFNIDDMSLENISYHGFSSSSGMKLTAKQEGIKLIFTLNDCRDEQGGILDVDQNGIDQWQYIPSRDIWNHNEENAKAEDIDIQNIRSSVAIMFALDCSTSLGDLFPLVKSTAASFIDRLAGGNGDTGIDDAAFDSDMTLDPKDPEVEVYNLQGQKITNPTCGIYICRKGNLTKKIVIK